MQGFHPPRPYPPPHRPPRPSPCQGYLVQKLIACEKRSVANLCAEWCFDGCDAQTIRSVTACGTPCWTLENGCTLHVSLPVNVQLCDSCGCCCIKQTCVNLETELPQPFICSLDDPRATLLILPCVRLLHAGSVCGSFRVQLMISLEICLLRYEICHLGPAKPECPQLPLYPPPIC